MGDCLFSDGIRTDQSPCRRVESRYAFLDRAAGTGWDQVRGLVQDWFSRFPDEAKTDLRGRFQTNDARAHSGAFFELFIHELLRKLGWTVTVHPAVPDTDKCPDFLASREGARLYVEATVVEPTTVFSDNRFEARVLDAIDDLPSPDFFLHVKADGELISAPPFRTVVEPFRRLMEEHDPDEVARVVESRGPESAPSSRVEHRGWSLTGWLFPKSANSRGNTDTRTIGVGPAKGGIVDSSTPLREAIHDKAGRYGNLDAPFLVAASAPLLHDRIDEMDALFGHEQLTFNVDSLETPPRPIFSREPNGVWVRGGYEPRHTRDCPGF